MATPLKHARRELTPGATVKAASPDETVENWLIRNGQTPRLRELLWDPLALAALNQPPEQAAAPPFARVLAEMFSDDPRAAAIALPTKPLHLMYAEPARAYIEAPRRRGPHRRGRDDRADRRSAARSPACASAARRGRPIASSRACRGSRWPSCSTRRRRRCTASSIARARMASSPIVTVNLWFDRRVLDQPFVGLPGPRDAVGVRQAPRVRRRRVAPVAGLERRGGRSWRETNDELVHRGARRAARRAAGRPRRHDCCAPPSSASRARRSRSRPASRRGPSTETGLQGFLLAGDWIDDRPARDHRERGPKRTPRCRLLHWVIG